MKKILLSTSAIVGVGLLASPTMAAERIKLAVGGYMEQYVGYAKAKRSNTASYDLPKWDIQPDTEVYFTGSTKLDNGIALSVVVELEGGESSGAASLDESYLRIVSPTLGELRLGGDDAVDALMVVQANRGISGDYDNWIVEGSALTKNDNLYDNAAGDVNKISYFTPKIAGFQVGMSFANTTVASEVDPPNYVTATVGGPSWASAVTYETKVGDVDVKLGATASRLSNSKVTTGRRNYQGGAQLGYMGFSLSGGYAMTETNQNTTNSTVDNLDGTRFQLGLQYVTGPYTVGVWHMSDTHEGITSVAADDVTKVYSAYGEYAVSDGVKLQGLVFKVDYKDETAANGNQPGGWGVVTGFRLDF